MTDDLVRWLGEQLDEDERIAREAAAEWGTAWTADHDSDTVNSDIEYVSVVEEPNSPVGFIAEWDPARVLREIDTKRKLLTDLLPDLQHADRLVEGEWGSSENVAERMLRLLALPYAGRPGYKEEWAP